jgi:hypothetical protein
MSEIVNNSLLLRSCSLLFRTGNQGYQRFAPDLFSARERAHQNILWIIWLFLRLLQRGTARLLAVISLFRDEKPSDSAAHGHSPAVFSLQ